MELSLTALDYVVGILALGGSIGVGLYLSMRVNSSKDSAGFFLGGRRLIWPIIGGTLFATNIGAEHVVGLSGDCYRYGLCASTIEVCALCLGIAAAFLYPYYLTNRVFTIPQFLELRYNKGARLFFSGFTLFVSIMMKLALCLFAGALVIKSLTGMDVMTTVALMGLCAAIITIVGGLTAVAYTDTAQSCIMILGGGIMLFCGLDKIGGWTALVNRVPEAMSIHAPYNHPDFPFWGIVAASFYAGIFYWGVDQTNVQRVLGGRDLNHARWGAMLAIFLKLSVVFIYAVPGVIAFALFPGRESKLTFVTLLNELLPIGVRGLVLAALLAAIISSVDSVLNSISTLVIRDFGLHLRPNMSERMQVLMGRLAILVCTGLGIGAAYLVYRTPGGVYRYFQTLGAVTFMAVTPAIIFGIMSRKVTTKGAFISVLVGIVLAGIFLADEWMGPEAGARVFPWLHTTLTNAYSYKGGWGFLCVTIALFVASAFTRKDPPEKLEGKTVDWSQKWERFTGLSDWRLHFAILTVLTIAIYAWLW